VVAQIVVGAALLRTDEVLELHRILDKENRRVVADHVVVALGGVELQRETAGITPGVRAASLAGHRGEPGQHVGLGARLEYRGLGIGTDIVGHLEPTEGAAALGVRLALRNSFAVELRHLLDEVVILQKDRAVRTDGERVLITRDRDTGIGRRRLGLLAGHCGAS